MVQLAQHPDPEVRRALFRLSDALVQWERNSGKESVFILREMGGFAYRALNGIPGVSDDISDDHLLKIIEGGK